MGPGFRAKGPDAALYELLQMPRQYRHIGTEDSRGSVSSHECALPLLMPKRFTRKAASASHEGGVWRLFAAAEDPFFHKWLAAWNTLNCPFGLFLKGPRKSRIWGIAFTRSPG